MAFNINKILVVGCMSFFVIMLILLEFYSKSASLHETKNSTRTHNTTAKQPNQLLRRLKSVVNPTADQTVAIPNQNRKLTTRAKRFLEKHRAQVQDFSSQQLESQYEKLGFRSVSPLPLNHNYHCPLSKLVATKCPPLNLSLIKFFRFETSLLILDFDLFVFVLHRMRHDCF